MKKTTYILSILTILISIQPLWFIKNNARANTTPTIIITEVMTNPEDENKDEFIELYNTSTAETINLAGWQFTDGDALDTLMVWDPEKQGLLKDPDVITGKTELSPKSFAIILDPDYVKGEQPYDFPLSTLILTITNTTLGNGLSAESDPLTLYNGQGTLQINIVDTYGTPNLSDNWAEQDDNGLDAIPFDPGNNYSAEKINFDTGDQEDNWQISTSELGTPGNLPFITPPNQAPIAEAGQDRESLVDQEIEFDGSQSQDPDGDDLTFSWDFGDGHTGEGEFITHYYEKSGIFTVTLTVSDGELENSDTLTVTVNEPDYSEQMIINEILPNPAGSDSENEFIELKNIGPTVVDLIGWKISDNTDNTYIISTEDFSSTEILPNDYFVIYNLVSGISLNNSGDLVELIQPNDYILQQVEYQDSAQENFSYAYYQENWQWTATPTPNAENILTKINQTPEAAAGEDKEALVGEEVEFDGSQSQDPDGDDLTFSWDFGDLEKGTGQIAKHVYQKTGEFTVTLEVSDGQESNTDTLEIVIRENQNQIPPANYSDKIIINEIYPYPNSGEDEFIELKNNDTREVDLTGWKLKDNSSRIFTITSDKITNTKIPANNYWIIYHEVNGISLNNTSGDSVTLFNPIDEIVDSIKYAEKAYQGQSYMTTTEGNWIWSSQITPGKENVYVDTNNPPEVVLEAVASGKVGATLSFDASQSQDPDGDDLTFSWDFGDQQTATGEKVEHVYQKPGDFSLILTIKDDKEASTQKELNIEISDYQYSEQIVLNELMINVEGDDSEGEWIELANFSKGVIDLEGWHIADDKTDYLIPAEQIIPAEGFLVFTRPVTGITLNNDEDTLNLIDPRGKIIDSVHYTESYEDLSLIRLVGLDEWQWTETSTPEKDNVLTESEIVKESDDSNKSTKKETKSSSSQTKKKTVAEEEGYLSIALKDIRNYKKGDKVITRGLVAVEPGLLGSQFFYLIEQDKGIKIYSSKKDFPELKLGDYVEVQGALSESSSETKINIKTAEDIKILENKIDELSPITLDLGDIDEAYEGSLIQIEGEITDKKNSNFVIMDENGESITISIKSETKIDLKEVEEGKTIQVIGLVSQDKDVYKILPRYQEDLIFPEVLGAATAREEIVLESENQGIEQWQYWLIGGICLVGMIIIVVKKKDVVKASINKVFAKKNSD